MSGGKSSQEWINRYADSHRHPVNRFCHTIGIPLIAASIPLSLVILFVPGFWVVPALMFGAGWILQFIGHAFERKVPEFFHDWRFLSVGLRWWVAKISGRI